MQLILSLRAGAQEDWDPLDTRPQKNLDGEPNHGLQAARKTWRGIDNLYRDDPMGNPYYGSGVSGEPTTDWGFLLIISVRPLVSAVARLLV